MCYSMNLECSLQAHLLKALFQGNSGQRWLEHEVSNVYNKLIH